MQPWSPTPRAVIFDLDGTLIDSLPDITSALNQLLPAYGRRLLDQAEVRPMVGDGVRRLVEKAFAATGIPAEREQLPLILKRFMAIYENVPAQPGMLYPHVRETLAALRHAGIRVALCTNKPTTATDHVLAALELRAAFDQIVCGDTLATRKPDPAVIHLLLQRFGTTAAETVIVGDGINDVGAGRNAGIGVIVAAWGYDAAPERMGGDAVLQDLSGLPPLLGL